MRRKKPDDDVEDEFGIASFSSDGAVGSIRFYRAYLYSIIQSFRNSLKRNKPSPLLAKQRSRQKHLRHIKADDSLWVVFLGFPLRFGTCY